MYTFYIHGKTYVIVKLGFILIISLKQHLKHFQRNKVVTAQRKLFDSKTLHCTSCHNEQKLGEARGERTREDVEGRTGNKCYAKTGGDLMGKVHTITVHELAPDGNWQVGKAEENCIDKLCRGRP